MKKSFNLREQRFHSNENILYKCNERGIIAADVENELRHHFFDGISVVFCYLFFCSFACSKRLVTTF